MSHIYYIVGFIILGVVVLMLLSAAVFWIDYKLMNKREKTKVKTNLRIKLLSLLIKFKTLSVNDCEFIISYVIKHSDIYSTYTVIDSEKSDEIYNIVSCTSDNILHNKYIELTKIYLKLYTYYNRGKLTKNLNKFFIKELDNIHSYIISYTPSGWNYPDFDNNSSGFLCKTLDDNLDMLNAMLTETNDVEHINEIKRQCNLIKEMQSTINNVHDKYDNNSIDFKLKANARYLKYYATGIS